MSEDQLCVHFHAFVERNRRMKTETSKYMLFEESVPMVLKGFPGSRGSSRKGATLLWLLLLYLPESGKSSVYRHTVALQAFPYQSELDYTFRPSRQNFRRPTFKRSL